jgi:uncharacterized protein (DUF885 family)
VQLFPAFFASMQDVMREGVAAGITTPRVLVERALEQLDDLVPEDALTSPLWNQETLEATLRVAPSEDIAILHPRAADRYRQKVAAIHEALKRGEPASREAIALIRDLVQAINV